MGDPSVMHCGDWLEGDRVRLRLITLEDCNERYLQWLQDPAVNQFLETRWMCQTMETIRAFVAQMVADPSSYLFGIFVQGGSGHVGNIKVGPINPHHAYADISYFIGETSVRGKGYAADAIFIVTRWAFERRKLHRLQAGVYASNVASARSLERVGYRREAVLRSGALGAQGWEDVYGYGLLADEWQAMQAVLR
jgi:RimJ/RimL family protein N-acetyltransferase